MLSVSNYRNQSIPNYNLNFGARDRRKNAKATPAISAQKDINPFVNMVAPVALASAFVFAVMGVQKNSEGDKLSDNICKEPTQKSTEAPNPEEINLMIGQFANEFKKIDEFDKSYSKLWDKHFPPSTSNERTADVIVKYPSSVAYYKLSANIKNNEEKQIKKFNVRENKWETVLSTNNSKEFLAKCPEIIDTVTANFVINKAPLPPLTFRFNRANYYANYSAVTQIDYTADQEAKKLLKEELDKLPEFLPKEDIN